MNDSNARGGNVTAKVSAGVSVVVLVLAVVSNLHRFIANQESTPPEVHPSVNLATLRTHPEVHLHYPGATVLSSALTAYVGTATESATFWESVFRSVPVPTASVRSNSSDGRNVGYWPTHPASSATLLAARAAAARIAAWYRQALESQGWCFWRHWPTRLGEASMYLRDIEDVAGQYSGAPEVFTLVPTTTPKMVRSLYPKLNAHSGPPGSTIFFSAYVLYPSDANIDDGGMDPNDRTNPPPCVGSFLSPDGQYSGSSSQ